MEKIFDIMSETFVGCVTVITIFMLVFGFSAFLGSIYSRIFELTALQEVGAGFLTISFTTVSWYVGHMIREKV